MSCGFCLYAVEFSLDYRGCLKEEDEFCECLYRFCMVPSLALLSTELGLQRNYHGSRISMFRLFCLLLGYGQTSHPPISVRCTYRTRLTSHVCAPAFSLDSNGSRPTEAHQAAFGRPVKGLLDGPRNVSRLW
jgi:hypothetical protein